MDFITKETFENNNIEVTVDKNGELWLNKKNIEENLGQKIRQSLQRNMIQFLENIDMN